MLRNDLFVPWFVTESDNNEEAWGVEIISGEFQGTVVQIEKIDFSDKEDGSVDINYHVINKPDTVDEKEFSSEMFEKTMGLIVNDILLEAVSTLEAEKGEDKSTTGTNDSSEPNPQ